MAGAGVRIEGLDRLTARLNKEKRILTDELKAEIEFSTRRVKTEYRTGVKDNSVTGELKRSIDYNITHGGLRGEVGSDLYYAKYIEYGTKPHIIEVKKAPVLTDGEGNFFGKRVNHPGYIGNQALQRAWLKIVGVRGRELIRRLKSRLKSI